MTRLTASLLTFALALSAGLGVARAQTPGEVTELRFCAGSKDCLDWTPTPGATSYVVHHGDADTLALLETSESDSCIIGTPTEATSGPILPASAGPTGLSWFLVTARNDVDEGPVGNTSDGPRVLDTHAACCGSVAVDDSFDVADGQDWPAPWVISGGVDLADAQGGRVRFRPSVTNYSLARMYYPLDLRDVEVEYTIEFEDVGTQGFGFYVRSNGGHLALTDPMGQGYASFIEGFRTSGIGLWKEVDGEEISLDINFDPAFDLVNDVPYRARFRTHQLDDETTSMRARFWREGTPEPEDWQILFDDTTPVLQGLSGGIAVDAWSTVNPGTPGNPTPSFIYLDDVLVTPLCNPLAGRGPLTTLATGLSFAEGPVWFQGGLLFSDINANSILRLVSPGVVETYRTPSDQSNGLMVGIEGELLAAEHGTRRISSTDAVGTVSTLVDSFEGQRFNSPNDLIVRSDGTLYFTDPAYGLGDPMDRELPFNGLFRLAPGGELTAEWMGPEASGPNGVALSPDESVLYMSDAASGFVWAFDVAPDGSLSSQREFAAGLTTPDGMVVDADGNLYVATWGASIEVFSPDGMLWGRITLPEEATNCTFGGPDGMSLYVTTRTGLHSVELGVPGL